MPGVDLGQVAALVGVDHDPTPKLSPQALIERLRHALATSTRLTAQLPAAYLGDKLPNRDRTNLALANHVVEIAARYIDVEDGADFDHAASGAVPPTELGRDALAARSLAIQRRLGHRPGKYLAEVVTFFGPLSLHAVLERCTWHAVQHVRQQAMVLQDLGIAPAAPLGDEDFAGLPLPVSVWDG